MEDKRIVHVVNGDDIADRLYELRVPGEVLVWREMLCEGPTPQDVGSKEFLDMRQQFLNKAYGVTARKYQEKFVVQLKKLKDLSHYDEIILWFEFDLFSHMNMLAAISYMLQFDPSPPLYLVCSGKVKGEQELVPLSELSSKQLQLHYDYKISLTEDDLEMANLIWEVYCGENPMRLTSEIKKTTNFRYLSSCLRAHIERFPNAKSGLNSLETNVLRLIDEHEINSLHHLLGYALKYQGYYGYVDIQMQRIIDRLGMFYTTDQSRVRLNENGQKALKATKNFYQELKQEEYFGGVAKYSFLYEPDSHNLLKL